MRVECSVFPAVGTIWKGTVMAQHLMSGADAKRYVRAGQLAAAVLAVAAVSLWALDVPGMDRLPPEPVVKPGESSEPKPLVVATARIDSDAVSGLAVRLDEAVVKAPPPPPPTPVTEAPPEAPAGPAWAFLGPIFESERSLAVVSVDGHQKVLGEGRKYGETTLVSVSMDEIVIDGPGGRKTIKKSERAPGLAVAWVKNLPTNTPGNPAAIAANMGRAQGGMSPEVAARLRERGIDPNQMGRGGGRGNFGGPGGGRQDQGGRGGRGRDDGSRSSQGSILAPGTAMTFTTTDGNIITRVQGGAAGDDATVSEDGSQIQIVRPRGGAVN